MTGPIRTRCHPLFPTALGLLAGVLVFFVSSLELAAQGRGGFAQRLGVGTGFDYLQSRDDMGSPLRYEGLTFPLQLEWGLRTRGGLDHGVELALSVPGFNAGRMRAAIAEGDNHTATVAHGAFGYSLLLPVARTLPGYLSLGGRWSNQFYFRSYTYEPHQIGSVEVWDFFSSLDLTGRLTRPIGRRHEVAAELAIPVLAYVNRPSYGVRGDERVQLVFDRWQIVQSGSFASWNTLQMANLRLGYRYRVAARWQLGATYAATFYRYTEPLPTRGLTNRFSVGVNWLF